MLCIGETLGWSPWLSWLLTFIIGGSLIALVIWLIFGSSQHKPTTETSALDLVKKRYAKGEITKEEYDQYRKDLS
jgi:putative membrane protein